MIWESTFLIIQNCKMYEKLNVEKAEQMNTGINKTKWGGEVKVCYHIVCSVQSKMCIGEEDWV